MYSREKMYTRWYFHLVKTKQKNERNKKQIKSFEKKHQMRECAIRILYFIAHRYLLLLFKSKQMVTMKFNIQI